MKYQLSDFTEFLKTPFPYLFLVLCLFLASTLLSNTGFTKSFTRLNQPEAAASNRNSDTYKLCIVCSGPGSKDALSDIGFTVANFTMFPVSLGTFVTIKGIGAVQGGGDVVPGYLLTTIFLTFSLLYGVVLPFAISKVYEAADARISSHSKYNSVYIER